MVATARSPETSALEVELGAALSTLESTLAEAAAAVAVIRGILPEVAALTAVVGELEATMARARQRLNVPPQAAQSSPPPPPLRPVPPPEDPPEPLEQESQADEPTAIAAEAEVGQAEAEQASPVSRCLRLHVTSKSGSLDLKAVDGSVNENPAVVDVALLDYDGRNAALKVWMNESADPIDVREALLESLRRHLAEDEGAEVEIDFEKEAAA